MTFLNWRILFASNLIGKLRTASLPIFINAFFIIILYSLMQSGLSSNQCNAIYFCLKITSSILVVLWRVSLLCKITDKLIPTMFYCEIFALIIMQAILVYALLSWRIDFTSNPIVKWKATSVFVAISTVQKNV